MKKINLLLLLSAFSMSIGSFSYAGGGHDSDSESTHSDSGSENGERKVRKPVIVVGKPKKIESVPGDDIADILEDTRNQAGKDPIGYKKAMQQKAFSVDKILAGLDDDLNQKPENSQHPLIGLSREDAEKAAKSQNKPSEKKTSKIPTLGDDFADIMDETEINMNKGERNHVKKVSKGILDALDGKGPKENRRTKKLGGQLKRQSAADKQYGNSDHPLIGLSREDAEKAAKSQNKPSEKNSYQVVRKGSTHPINNGNTTDDFADIMDEMQVMMNDDQSTKNQVKSAVKDTLDALDGKGPKENRRLKKFGGQLKRQSAADKQYGVKF